jgi:inward rectifier potassium channel
MLKLRALSKSLRSHKSKHPSRGEAGPTRQNNQNNPEPFRAISRVDGKMTIQRFGLEQRVWDDLYHSLLRMPWGLFLLLTGGLYVGVNLVFALAYLLQPDSLANAKPGDLGDAFFFSVQTMATIGYGAIAPKTLYANILVVIEAWVGLLGVAMITGLMFARFSRPTARVRFSEYAVVAERDGVPALMFRAANQRSNQILEAKLWVTLVRNDQTEEGEFLRRISELPLVRSQSAFFQLTWTAVHPIDEHSPLYGETLESLRQKQAEVVVTLTGTDETVAQNIHARYSYIPDEIVWNHRFADMFIHTGPGKMHLDYGKFDELLPL